MRRLVTVFLVIPLLGAASATTAAQAPTAAEELLAGMVTEEVEPGVFRVINDGVRDLLEAHSIVVGDDGSVWASRDHGGPSGQGGIFRLGGELIDTQHDAWAVTPDGTLWADSFLVCPPFGGVG